MTTPVRTTGTRLGLEALEAREVPAINLAFDFTLDLRANGGSGFFEDNPAARAALVRVGQEMGGRVSANLAAITPSGTNGWTAGLYNPSTGQQYTVSNLRVAANTLVVYVGGRAMPGPTAAQGGAGGYGWSGSAAWGSTVATRGWSGFAPWGGSLAFDTTESWYFGTTTSGLTATATDFYSVATHELGHLLGIGTAPQWFSKVQGGSFTGGNSVAAHGRAVPVSSDAAHWAVNTTHAGQAAAMAPVLQYGVRHTWTSLDQAALLDVGWRAASPVTPPTSPPPPPPPPVTAAPVLVSGSAGQVAVYARNGTGSLAYTGTTFTPFAVYSTAVRTAVGDFNGDGVADYAFVIGAGRVARVQVVNGATNATMVGTTVVLGGFTGGAYVAAGDINGDGRDELVVSADRGRSSLVEVYTVSGGALVRTFSFSPFGNLNTFGGRITMGDLNRDGRDELVYAGGPGMAPRVVIYNGAALAAKRATPLGPSFLAFAQGVRSGVNVAAGDIDGDGYADLIVSQDAGGTSLVRVWSGRTVTTNPGTPVPALARLQEFYANGTTDRSGIRVAARDLDSDGKDELVTSASGGTANWVRVLSVSANAVAALETVFTTSASAVVASQVTAPAEGGADLWFPPSGPCLCCRPTVAAPMCSRVTG
ncbi:peptidase m10a and m12b matrixin and adamalysin : Calx-beta domain-containing protein OS=Singulisphaera acidiphila (strain ATCC BAA-1392 / DSM 18658 / VKM B-2454 / MOB10) GN=Sinac_5612 PE=4 SV=1: Peptidase_M10: FG-GAP: VCBS [Gemmataceae bacterium]|nr:peptidase m10a and m12b matrixin and adamalysin : Calx-beta domain-containing protein OS=Singulisphaera acidiphila (strain ATCC BAA-1392 / DSM 18658 / VKM B-2454 / MOB10) GN=Sinac_5612 PE=4 SV=1: Peptidase_M10: FG-GAP: VCBS [Gemmataceae bacterium]VTT97326.1 peptidase m10a and m12b matrixin and adamalysin : Calx-beta domain-containing protein OS=Singulisphaera acidiphila (strain ATCC BAA-1392 / DSM 18658 / VKM B-2454 / MOB10) GN=Sinac_5612 PE=4 SV=1: Peptidase_M10: FG-GAP: VCBS [Gemmataceae bact